MDGEGRGGKVEESGEKSKNMNTSPRPFQNKIRLEFGCKVLMMFCAFSPLFLGILGLSFRLCKVEEWRKRLIRYIHTLSFDP